MKFFLKTALCILFFSNAIFSAYRSGELRKIHRGVRPLGMGGAHIAVAEDYNALFYNPAGLNNVEKWRVEFFTIGLGISSQIKNIYNNLDKLNGDVADIAGIVEDSIGSNHHFAVEILPSWVMPNFGLAIIEDLKLNLRIRNQAVPEVGIDAKNDVGGVVGLAGRVKDRIQWGFALKSIYRISFEKKMSAPEILNDMPEIKELLNEGQGWGFDIGVNYFLPGPYKQKVGLQISDLLNTRFNLGIKTFIDEAGTPSELGRTFNLGYKIEPPAVYNLRPLVAIDLRDVLNESKSTYIKRFHFGTEVAFPFIFKARMGLNQGYFTCGLTANFWLVSLDLLTYAEELGVGYQKPDRRYYLKLTFGI